MFEVIDMLKVRHVEILYMFDVIDKFEVLDMFVVTDKFKV